MTVCRAGALGLGLTVAAVVPAAAQDFYTPGGGFHVNARLLACPRLFEFADPVCGMIPQSLLRGVKTGPSPGPRGA
jgi:hypothetical protein